MIRDFFSKLCRLSCMWGTRLCLVHSFLRGIVAGQAPIRSPRPEDPVLFRPLSGYPDQSSQKGTWSGVSQNTGMVLSLSSCVRVAPLCLLSQLPYTDKRYLSLLSCSGLAAVVLHEAPHRPTVIAPHFFHGRCPMVPMCGT